MSDLFKEQIEAARSAESVPDAIVTLDHSSGARLEIRPQGCFVTDLRLIDRPTGRPVEVLYSEPDLAKSKLSASHIMSPVGPSDGIGGQHGFARWATYHEFRQHDGQDDSKYISFQAKRPDLGLGISKEFALDRDVLSMETTLRNSEGDPIRTSVGEHLYFALENEVIDGLMLNGQSLDELLGEGSEADIMDGEAAFWPDFDGVVEIKFPAGHRVMLSTYALGTNVREGMLIWHRKGTSSICFEPTLGFSPDDGSEQLEIAPYDRVTFSTSIKVSGGPS